MSQNRPFSHTASKGSSSIIQSPRLKESEILMAILLRGRKLENPHTLKPPFQEESSVHKTECHPIDAAFKKLAPGPSARSVARLSPASLPPSLTFAGGCRGHVDFSCDAQTIFNMFFL